LHFFEVSEFRKNYQKKKYLASAASRHVD